MGKTKQNKKNRNKSNQRKKTRRFRGGATSQNVNPNSIGGYNLSFLGSYFKMPSMKFEMPSMFKSDLFNNPFGTSSKNKCDVCDTDECKKDLAKNTATNEPTPPPKTEEKDEENDDKPPMPAETGEKDDKKSSSPPPPPQIGGKKNKNKNKKTRSRKKKSKK